MENLILIPGLGSDSIVWDYTVAALGDAADCSIADTLSDDSLPAMAERLLASAPERFSLAGLSMGGMVALEVMRLAPERVNRLALVDTNARPDTPEQTQQRRWNNAAMAKATDLRALGRAYLPYLVHPDSIPAVGEDLVEMTVRVGVDASVRQTEAVIVRPDLRPLLPSIKVPTLVVVGEKDTMTPLPMAEEIASGIPGAKLVVMRDCGHLPPIEKPGEMADLLKAWLRDQA